MDRLLDLSAKHNDRLRFHMPGHKGKLLPYPLPISSDLTELPRTDDLYQPTSVIAEVQQAAARSAHSSQSIMLTNGSTAGVLCMVMHTLKRGDLLITSRNAHHSAANGCGIAAAKQVIIDLPQRDDGLVLPDPSVWIDAMHIHKEARAVLITTPDYYGLVTPLDDIAREAHRIGMRLLVDQAHGAHWNWWDDTKYPTCAGLSGADMWVQSAHKTLPAPGQCAWLHMAANINADQARKVLSIIQTSSPSYMLMTALDCVREYMDRSGARLLCRLVDMIPESWPNGLYDPRTDLIYDPTRIVLDVSRIGMTGHEAARRLAHVGVDIERSDERRIILIASVADDPCDYERLIDALTVLASTLNP